MENRNIQAVALVTLLVAAALSADAGNAAQERLSPAASSATGYAGPHFATPRARPDVRIARLQANDVISRDAVNEPAHAQVPLPRPRPQYFDLRIDMTGMLGKEDLAAPLSGDRIAEAHRPSDDDPRELR